MLAPGMWRAAAAVVLVGLLAACDAHPTGRAVDRHGVLALDLSALSGRMTVIQRVELTIEGPGGFRQQIVEPIGRGEATKAFEVNVPVGSVQFSVELYSNRGVRLSSGSTTAEIRQNGFAVEVVPLPVAPILIVSPDTLVLRSLEERGVLTIANRGAATTWWTANIGNERCIGLIEPDSGHLNAGGSVDMFVVRYLSTCSTGPGTTIVFESSLGNQLIGTLQIPVVFP